MSQPEGAKKVKELTSRIRKRDGEISDYLFGKVQPQAIPLEEAVLGALMLDKDALVTVMDIISEKSFYDERNGLIYKAIKSLFEKSYPVDLLTVTEELKRNGDLDTVGGPAYLVELTNRVASSANIEYHARIIAQKHIQRQLIKVATGIIHDAYEDTTDVFDLLDDAERGLFEITQSNLSRQHKTMGQLTSELMKLMDELKNKKDGLTGVPTGFTKLDRLTSGWQPSDLVIIAARPGMGKTSFVLALARNAAIDFQKPVAIFSLEMSGVQLVQRIIALEGEIDSHKMRNGKLEDYEWTQLNHTIEKLSEAPIFIDDTPGINIFELRAKCRRLKKQHDIQMVIIDYLQLMSGTSENKNTNREQEISNISRSLKGLAKELNVPVIALSQLSRAVETRGGDKKPQLSDLRESGAIEQDADMVSFIYRPEYYEITESPDGRSLKEVAEIIIAKNRHGPTETVELRWVSKYAKFTDMDDNDFDSFPSMDPFGPSDDDPGVITKPSRMNDDEDIPF
ncbi:MAG: replicative DNA helicase [Saprospiraceae bacterium]|nr:replicative DNA helicase [Saprospirales bacterium]